jgi:hypothetical protein
MKRRTRLSPNCSCRFDGAPGFNTSGMRTAFRVSSFPACFGLLCRLGISHRHLAAAKSPSRAARGQPVVQSMVEI